MSEEQFEALMNLIDLKIEMATTSLHYNRQKAAKELSKLKQEFINVFIFGDNPSEDMGVWQDET